MIRLSTSEKYRIELPEGHKFPMQKYELIRQQLEYEGAIKPEQVFHPEFITDEVIELAHCPLYWARAKQNQLSDREIRRIGFPRSEVLVQRSLSSASGTVQCARNALEDGCGINLAGGTHHAFFDKGEGFCLLNDVAIAARWLLAQKLVKKVLVVDLDVHQGNGTASIFAADPAVFTFSMHCKDNYPYQKEVSDLDVEIPAFTDDVTYLDLLHQYLPRLYEEINPDIVFYVAGVDVLQTDRLGRLNLSLQGCRERDKWVISQAKIRRIPLVIVMGGGYSPLLNTVVKAHCNTFKLGLEIYGQEKFFRN
ncbi:MAG: histone deacetylase [Bacteroidia bacterium]|nr:histone deacetylase [Bacteroidia bacterium]